MVLEVLRQAFSTVQSLREFGVGYVSCNPDGSVVAEAGGNRLLGEDLQDFREALDMLPALSSLRFDGMFTHFAVSEIPDPSFTAQQASRFEQFVREAHERGYRPIVHAANSGAIFYHPSVHYDMVRGGILCSSVSV